MERRKKKVIAKSIAIAVFLIILFLLYPFLSNLVEHPPGENYIDVPKEFKYKFVRELDFSALPTTRYTVNITIPKSNEFQTVQVYDQSPYSKRIFYDYNRTWWSYSLSGNSEITIVYTGVSYAKIWDIQHSGGVEDIPQTLKEKYDHSEYIYSYENGKKVRKYVITPSTFFKKLTENLTRNKYDVVGKLRAIYDFIVHNFYYEAETGDYTRSANETWENRSGDCDELSFLFASMARSIGIPAWVEYGMLYDGTTWGGHAWIRTVVPVNGKIEYVNIDLTAEVGREDYGRGFLIRDPYRITEWEDDGNSEHLASYYVFYTYPPGRSVRESESVNVEYAKTSGHDFIPVGETIPPWLMLLVILIVATSIFVAIIRW